MMNIKILWGCAFALICFACSSDMGDAEEVFPPLDGDAQIVPTSNLTYVGDSGEPENTRAGGVIDPNAAISVSLFRADVVYPTSWSGFSALPASINTSGTVTFDTPQYYLTNGNSSKLVGVYPAVGNGGTWSATNGTVTFTIDGYTDIMGTSIVEASKSTTQPALTFNHLLSQIEFTILGEDATAISLWGTVNSISVSGRPNSCVVQLPMPDKTGAATATFDGSATLTARSKSGGAISPTTITTAEETFGYCLLAPTSSVQLSLSVVTSVGGTTTVTLPAKVYEAGKAYKVQLKFAKTAIVPTATISDWTSGGEAIKETL